MTRRRYNNKSCNVIEIQVSSAILTIVGILSYIYYIILLCCGLLIKRERYIVHRINTGSALPNKQRPIPVPPAVETKIAQVVNEMLENKICRPSNSPWASRVLLVTKRDGSKRFVVDYRKLNEVTQIDSYPMPCDMDILDRMSGHKYFSFVDGASAYWSIGVEESDKYKTAFVTQRGCTK